MDLVIHVTLADAGAFTVHAARHDAPAAVEALRASPMVVSVVLKTQHGATIEYYENDEDDEYQG